MIHLKVSVPYRGATFLNLFAEFFLVVPLSVSVPYRGATFLNLEEKRNENIEQFPSPIGELHFSIQNNQHKH